MRATRSTLITAVLFSIASSAAAQSPARATVDASAVTVTGDALDPVIELQAHLLAVANEARRFPPVIVVASSRYGVTTIDAAYYARAVAESARAQALADAARLTAVPVLPRATAGGSTTSRAIAAYERAVIATALADSYR